MGLLEAREDYQAGRKSREEYWSEMRSNHALLRQYQAILKDSPIKTIHIEDDSLSITTTANVSMIWDPEDVRDAPNTILNYGVFESGESELLLSTGEGARVILDVGANIGYYSLHWSTTLAKSGRIYAFEPVPSTFSRLVRNISLNDAGGRIFATNVGLGEEMKTVKFYLPKFSGSVAASEKNLHPDEENLEVSVHLDTLDGFAQKNNLPCIDLLKIDVEGAELFVIRGGAKTIALHKPIIFIELLRKWSKKFGYHPNDVASILKNIGYKCCAIFDKRLIEIGEISEITPQTNFFFYSPEKHQSWAQQNGLL